MFDVRYEGLRLIPSKAALDELIKYSLMMQDCKEMLENGYDAPRKRARDTKEKWFNKGKSTFNVVIVHSFNYDYNEPVWLITHVGKFTRRRIL